MDATAYVRTLLADVRLLVAFVASPSWPRDDLQRWPAAWCRADDGSWHPLDFGRSHRARQLLTLLAVHPDGLNGPAASVYFDVDADAAGASGRDERAKSALGTLRAKLSDNGVADLSHLLVVPRGHRRAQPWRLDAVTTDVRLAATAAAAEQWAVAWLLLHGGAGQLVGVPRARTKGGRRVPPHLGVLGGQRRAMRTGVLPVTLIDEAESVTRSVIAHFERSAVAPPPVSPTVVGEMLEAVAPRVGGHPAPAGALDAAPAATTMEVSPGRLPAAGLTRRGSPTEPVEIRPLTVPARRRGRWRVPASMGAAGLVAACAIVLALVLLPGRPVASAVAFPASLSGSGGRLEVQTFVSDANSFANPHALDAPIVRIRPGTTVLVACRQYVPGPRSIAPYWWYHLLSRPVAGRWVPANSFLNGDPASDYIGPHPHAPAHQHAVDTAVALCGAGEPGGTRAVPLQSGVPTFAATTGADAGPAIEHRDPVTVSCRVPSTAAASEPGGFAYRIASAPWDGRFYAPARAFRNAIPADSRSSELVDPEVPLCPRS